jgi:hypothetical protein
MLMNARGLGDNLTRLVPFNKPETMAAEYCTAAMIAAQPMTGRYRIENCTGMLKLIDACFRSGGIGGNGCARRTIASVSLSSDG